MSILTARTAAPRRLLGKQVVKVQEPGRMTATCSSYNVRHLVCHSSEQAACSHPVCQEPGRKLSEEAWELLTPTLCDPCTLLLCRVGNRLIFEVICPSGTSGGCTESDRCVPALQRPAGTGTWPTAPSNPCETYTFVETVRIPNHSFCPAVTWSRALASLFSLTVQQPFEARGPGSLFQLRRPWLRCLVTRGATGGSSTKPWTPACCWPLA